MPDAFEQRLLSFAERAVRISPHCVGVDASRIYLVMPFLELLGYDTGDPAVVVPEHDDAIGFSVMVDGSPAIAIEATGSGTSPAATYGRLRAYAGAHKSVGLAIATNGMVFEMFTDSRQPGTLDAEPFLTVDLAGLAAGPLDRDHLALLQMVTAARFDSEALAEKAYAMELREKLKVRVLGQFREPSESLCRLLLGEIGIDDATPELIDQHYRVIVREAMERAVVVPVVQVLRSLTPPAAPVKPVEAAERKVVTVDRARVKAGFGERLGEELAAFSRVKRQA